MWCKTCQQDVPGLISSHAGNYRCSRCGAEFCDRQAGASAPTQTVHDPAQAATWPREPVSAGIGPGPPPTYDGWELDEQLRHIERLLDTGKPDDGDEAPSRRYARLDAAHAGTPGWHYPAAARARAARERNAGARPS